MSAGNIAIGSRGWQLATIQRLALLYAESSRRSYTNDPGDATLMRDGIRNYTLAIMPERVLRRAFKAAFPGNQDSQMRVRPEPRVPRVLQARSRNHHLALELPAA